ncbi:MAG: hypothetical protein Q9215_003664 [Flavoplaca cf. flavocitrina]
MAMDQLSVIVIPLPPEVLAVLLYDADGKCVVEVGETVRARGSYIDLKEAAEEATEVCLEYKEKAEGAVATNIGKSCPLFEMPMSPSTETAAMVASLLS